MFIAGTIFLLGLMTGFALGAVAAFWLTLSYSNNGDY